METDLEAADALLFSGKFNECVHLLDNISLRYKHPDVYWRQARAVYMQTYGGPEKPPKHELRERFTNAFNLTLTGLEMDKNNANCLILSLLEGTSARIRSAFRVRDLWEKALEIDPSNYLVYNCLGVWCFEVADVSSVKRAIAKTFFTSPPKATYEESLRYLNKCEELAPKFVIGTLMTLAKCHERLHNDAKAIEYCHDVLNYRDVGIEVSMAKMEARKLLKKLTAD
ncbi:unnamed protein product [Dicrocoelium dendriticum]|nr:unnamed protein product [Dicrocoelium dendriticum]